MPYLPRVSHVSPKSLKCLYVAHTRRLYAKVWPRHKATSRNGTWLSRNSSGVYVAIMGCTRSLIKWSEFSLYLSLRLLHGEWRQWLLLLEWISSEPDESPLVEKWIFTLLELESSEIHSSTSEISSLHWRSELCTRFFFYREYTAITVVLKLHHRCW